MAKLYKSMAYGTSEKPSAALLKAADTFLPFSEATGILDNGCGPGPIMTRILDGYKIPQSCQLTCSDFSEGMISQVRQHKEETVKADSNSPWSRVESIVQDATNLKDIADDSQSHVTAGFVRTFTAGMISFWLTQVGVLHDIGPTESLDRVEASAERWWRIVFELMARLAVVGLDVLAPKSASGQEDAAYAARVDKCR